MRWNGTCCNVLPCVAMRCHALPKRYQIQNPTEPYPSNILVIGASFYNCLFLFVSNCTHLHAHPYSCVLLGILICTWPTNPYCCGLCWCKSGHCFRAQTVQNAQSGRHLVTKGISGPVVDPTDAQLATGIHSKCFKCFRCPKLTECGRRDCGPSAFELTLQP